jgi:hypothetical protein
VIGVENEARKVEKFFICNNCRSTCDSSNQCTKDLLDGDLYPRKQAVECLGKWCDDPCDLQQEGNLNIEQLIVLVKFLGDELNKLLVESSQSEPKPGSTE